MTPFFAIVLGLLIGWLAQWFLETWYFRARTVSWQRQAELADEALRQRDEAVRRQGAAEEAHSVELAVLRAEIETLRARLARAEAAGAAPTGAGHGLLGATEEERPVSVQQAACLPGNGMQGGHAPAE